MKRVALIAAGLVLAGCGGKIDGDDLEGEIKKDAEERGIVVDAVDCPSPETDEGATFTCTITVKGQPSEFDVVQVDGDGNVRYDFGGVVEGPAVNDTEADKASIDAVIDSVDRDITALCDYATPSFRKELAAKESCAQAVLADYDTPLIEDYQLSVDGDTAAATDDTYTVTFERRKNGSWLITDVR
jgi:Domain of unknown function (DUF4333)